MPLLLDTHVFVWLAWGDRRVSHAAIEAISVPGERIYLSVVSHWELQIKGMRSDFDLGAPFDVTFARSAFLPLALDFDVPRRLDALPKIHKDPFDRILIAQALAMRLTLVTRDAAIRRYPVPTLW